MTTDPDLLDAALIICAEYDMDEDEDWIRRNQQVERLDDILRRLLGETAYQAAIAERLKDRPRLHAQPRRSPAEQIAAFYRDQDARRDAAADLPPHRSTED